MSDNEKFLKIGQAAKALKVSPQTLRNWLKIKPTAYSPQATRAHDKRISEGDLKTLRKVKRLLSQGKLYAQIEGELEEIPQVYAEGEEPEPEWETQPEPTTALATRDMFEFVQQLLDAKDSEYQRTLDAKDETIELLRQENERLRRPWWKRLFP